MTAKPKYPVVLERFPLDQDKGVCYFKEGTTLVAALGDNVDETWEVRVAGTVIPREDWASYKPVAGVPVLVTGLPRGGGGGSKILRTVLLVAVAVAAWYVAATYGALAGAAVSMLGAMAVNALVPPPKPSVPNSSTAFNRLNSLTSQSNQANPYGTIPLVVGTAQFYPPLAALPYTEISGDDQYLRMLLDCGYGTMAVSNLQIGGTPISNFTDVEYQIGTNPSLFSQDITEDTFNTTLNDGQNFIRTSQTQADELSIDFAFLAGLMGVDSKGNTKQVTATITVEYSPTGANTWTSVASLPTSSYTISNGAMSVSGSNFQVKNSSRKAIRCGLRWKVANGQYDVRITRGTTNWNGSISNGQVGDGTYECLRTIRYKLPSTTGTTKIALRIKATDQLNGTVNQLSCTVAQSYPVWNGTAWSTQATSNPAWVYYNFLNACPATAKQVAASSIDLTTIYAFANWCTANNLACNGVIDASGVLFDAIKTILAAGQATFAMHNGKYSVVYDPGGGSTVQAFTPVNCTGFSGQRVFTDLPHALRVKYINPQANWQQDEVIVLNDGYSFNGVDSHGNASANPVATKFEVLQLDMVTDPYQAWKIGRFHFAQATYRANTYTWKTDVEGLVCERGDVIQMTHDVLSVASGFGRIASVTVDGSNNATAVVFDAAFDLPGGATYVVNVRRQDGQIFQSQITPTVYVSTSGGAYYGVTGATLSSPINNVNPGDMFTAGVSGTVQAPMLITRIQPDKDLTATITAVDYDSRVYSFVGTPPASIVSSITGVKYAEPPNPPNLVLVYSNQVSQAPNDGGNSAPAINVNVKQSSSLIRSVPGGLARVDTAYGTRSRININ